MPDLDDDVPVTHAEVDADLWQRFVDAREAFTEVSEYYEGLKAQIRGLLDAAHDDTEPVAGLVGNTVVARYRYVRSRRLDSGRLKREWPDLYDQYSKSHGTWTLTFPREQAS